jgi:carbamoyltransferase
MAAHRGVHGCAALGASAARGSLGFLQYFLSFSYNLHDSSVSIADERRVLLVLEAERFFGEKKKACTHAEMEQLVKVALDQCGIGIDAVTSVACTAYRNEHLPEKLRDVRWLDETRIQLGGRSFDTLIVNHHLSHAAMVHAFPQATDTVIDVCDGGGDFGDTHFVYRCRNGRIEALPNQPIHDAFSSRFYDIVSRYLYGRIMCEGKLMALASLGKPRPDIMSFLREHLPMFHSAPPEQSLAELRRKYPVEHYSRSQTAFDLAASVQRLFEDLRVESVLALPREAPFVLLAGGATLNIVANSRVRQAIGPGRQLLLPPCCDDTGQSLGALLLHCHEKVGAKVTAALPFLGYSDRLGERPLAPADVSDELVSFLVGGGIVFLHRGQSEIGPRALGHRSILALPSRRSFDLINHVIKQREFYRPLAPLVTRETVGKWFEFEGESKYMLYSADARPETMLAAPGICHYDRSARVQTVDGAEDPFLHALLAQVGQATGIPILINTSLNGRGMPIASKLTETLSFRRTLPDLGLRVFHGGQFCD